MFFWKSLAFWWSSGCWQFDVWFTCLFWNQVEHQEVHGSCTAESWLGEFCALLCRGILKATEKITAPFLLLVTLIFCRKKNPQSFFQGNYTFHEKIFFLSQVLLSLQLPFPWPWHHSYKIRWLHYFFKRIYFWKFPFYAYGFFYPECSFKLFTCQLWIHLWRSSDSALLSQSLYLSFQQT